MPHNAIWWWLALKNKDIERYINVNMIERLLLFIRGGKSFYTTMVVYDFDAVVD
jgi:hypothetical protein